MLKVERSNAIGCGISPRLHDFSFFFLPIYTFTTVPNFGLVMDVGGRGEREGVRGGGVVDGEDWVVL